jgi:hypothetical protein
MHGVVDSIASRLTDGSAIWIDDESTQKVQEIAVAFKEVVYRGYGLPSMLKTLRFVSLAIVRK